MAASTSRAAKRTVEKRDRGDSLVSASSTMSQVTIRDGEGEQIRVDEEEQKKESMKRLAGRV